MTSVRELVIFSTHPQHPWDTHTSFSVLTDNKSEVTDSSLYQYN